MVHRRNERLILERTVVTHASGLFRSQNYAFMLHDLMVMIQAYLLLSDDDKQRRKDNRICIWLEGVEEKSL